MGVPVDVFKHGYPAHRGAYQCAVCSIEELSPSCAGTTDVKSLTDVTISPSFSNSSINSATPATLHCTFLTGLALCGPTACPAYKKPHTHCLSSCSALAPRVQTTGGGGEATLTSDAPNRRGRAESQCPCSGEEHRPSHATHQHGYGSERGEPCRALSVGRLPCLRRLSNPSCHVMNSRLRNSSDAADSVGTPLLLCRCRLWCYPSVPGTMRHVSTAASLVALCCCQRAGGFVAPAPAGGVSVSTRGVRALSMSSSGHVSEMSCLSCCAVGHCVYRLHRCTHKHTPEVWL